MIFSLDIGTSILKGGIFDTSCNLIYSASAEIKLFHNNNSYEIDPEDWINALKKICTEVSKYKDISTIIISGNGPTLTPVDKNGNVLYRAITWMDNRSNKATNELLKNSPVNPSFFLSKAYWIYKNKPEIYKKTKYFLSCPEFLSFYLTGNAFTYLPNGGFKNFIWTDKAITSLGMDIEKFPEYLQPGAEAGTVKKQIAEELGLKPGIKVISGTYDFMAALIGTGTITPGTTCDRAGTSEGINHCTDFAVNDSFLICLPHLEPGLFNVSAMISTTGKAVEWYKNNSFYQDKDFESIYNDARTVSAGSDKLIFLPHLTGERGPAFSKDARGAFIGLSLDHSYKEMAKAVLESIGFSIRYIIEIMEKNSLNINELRIAGSLSKIEILNQIKADITGKVVLIPEIYDSELVGNACIGLVSMGEFKNIKEASLNCVKITKKIKPDKKLVGFYTEMYNIYKTAYNNLLPVFKELGELY